MKTKILIGLFLLIAVFVNAQNTGKKPSQINQATADSLLLKMGLTTVVKVEDLDDGADYIDSITAVMPPRTIITDNDTLLITDLGKTLWVNSSFDLTIVIPLNVFPVTAGATLTLWRLGTGEVTVVIIAGGTLNAPGGRTSINLQYDAASLTQYATNTWVMNGGTK